ncbi:hypothetical protein [Plantactinospora sp. CA-290183]|uniref:hypothetical protein n=1 Tax=Plantactinospora sp. CA-290183 TaxID=3240006 RepID=UPI003D8FBE4A
MHVLMSALDRNDAESLGRACSRNRILLHDAPADGAAGLEDDLLAVFIAEGTDPPVSPAEIRQHGAYAVQVQQTVSGMQMLHAARNGYHFVFGSPLPTDRVSNFLRYICDVAAPPRSQILRLTDTGTLVTPMGTAELEHAEVSALRLLGERRDGIVSRADLMSATGGSDPLRTINALRGRFSALGSGAQILKVPHMGYRLVGALHPAEEG